MKLRALASVISQESHLLIVSYTERDDVVRLISRERGDID